MPRVPRFAHGNALTVVLVYSMARLVGGECFKVGLQFLNVCA
jgi:hypothetical protein